MSEAERIIGKRVGAHQKRRCPHCQSNKWTWLGAVPISPEELAKYLLVKYRCERCSKEFLVEEAKKTRYVKSADRCVHCNSQDVEQTSKPDADIQLFCCRKCNAYMAIAPDSDEKPFLVINLPE